MQPDNGLNLISIAYGILALPGLCAGCAICAIPMPAVAFTGDAGVGETLIALLALGFGWLLTFGLGAALAATAWGIQQRRDWALWLGIGAGIVLLIGFPIGTVIGGLAIWFLLQPEVQDEFRYTEKRKRMY
jgi:hypothetical protein